MIRYCVLYSYLSKMTCDWCKIWANVFVLISFFYSWSQMLCLTSLKLCVPSIEKAWDEENLKKLLLHKEQCHKASDAVETLINEQNKRRWNRMRVCVFTKMHIHSVCLHVHFISDMVWMHPLQKSDVVSVLVLGGVSFRNVSISVY